MLPIHGIAKQRLSASSHPRISCSGSQAVAGNYRDFGTELDR
jgi:hypothetical protein